MSHLVKPLPNTGHVPGSFGYLTFVERIPVIITRLIDSLFNQSTNDSLLDFSETIKKLASLKHEITRNCCKISKVEDDFEDAMDYNVCIENLQSYHIEDSTATYRNGPWIATECIVYRKIFECFALTSNPVNMEYFYSQKEEQFKSDIPYITTMVHSTLDAIKSISGGDMSDKYSLLPVMFRSCLWANRMDLSLSGGLVVTKDDSKKEANLDNFLVCDETLQVVEYLKGELDGTVDIVLDNYASELVADLCLVLYLISKKIASRVRLHCKKIPWFVSDVQKPDVFRIMQNLRDINLSEFADLLLMYIAKDMITIEDHIFWTGPYTFPEMKNKFISLYEQLCESSLIIFKGDLNYRKLVSDYIWPIETSFKISLCEFSPAPIFAIRTLKSTTVSGVDLDRFEKLKLPEDWMVTGKYGVMQFSK